MRFPHFASKCFLCGAGEDCFDTATRVCSCMRLRGFPEPELSCYVTMLPELVDYSVSKLPSLWAENPCDVFAVAAGTLGSSSDSVAKQRDSIGDQRSTYLSPGDLLEKSHHLRCGNATLYRAGGLEDLTGSELVLVLDMGSYYWSGTLKDPRSWAIVNAALAHGITDISLWTAGNAGLSLAKLAYFANRRLSPDTRLQIHAIVDQDVDGDIRTQLRLWQCDVLDLFRRDKPVLNPLEIRGLVAARLRRSRRRLDDASYWHVTDGWDGVGLLAYRLVAAQIFRDLGAVFPTRGPQQAIDVVLPVGTGDLLLGFYLGLRDCERSGLIEPGSWRLIGAVPGGANILANIRQRSIPGQMNGSGSSPNGAGPVMPKLKGVYTPLAPCLMRMEKEGLVEFVVVTEEDQIRAGRQVLSGGIDDGIVAEPSALASFAALPYLGESSNGHGGHGEYSYHRGRRVLIVNSGLGVLGGAEEKFLYSALGSSVLC